MDKVSEEQFAEKRPMPDDFYTFLPFACQQFQINFEVVITKDLQHEYVSVGQQERMKRGKSKAKLPSRVDLGSDDNKDKSDIFQSPLESANKILRITATYDRDDNLIKLKFTKNKLIPRTIWKIMNLIIQFQPHLTNITINSGIDQYTIYEISKFLPVSQITEVVLDYSAFVEANYYLLFDTDNNLKRVSLAGCAIDNTILYTITSKLTYPQPASKKLRILNLTSNKITDIGAKYLADALRSNRHLSYLNLSGNRITDVGAAHLFDVLLEFPLTTEEIIESRQRQMLFLKRKNDVIMSILQELKAGDYDKKGGKRKTLRPPSTPLTKKGKPDKEPSLKSIIDANTKSFMNLDVQLYDKAVNMADNILGSFEDPFNLSNTVNIDDITYCRGNNSLLYLNVAYNHLSYIALNKILQVLAYQKSVDRNPAGLINVIIEGNPVPVSSIVLSDIDDIIDKGLESHRRMSGLKKRPHSKK